jgi:hypothetical protein
MSLLLGALADEDKLKGLASKGMMGAIPMMLARDSQRDSAEEERQKAIAASARGEGMKKGGMTASKRADGIAQRGKTRGRMV